MATNDQTVQQALQLIEQLNADKQQLRELYEKSVALVKHLNQETAHVKSQLKASMNAREELQREIQRKQREWSAELEGKAREFEALRQQLQSPMETEELRLKMLSELDDSSELKQKVGIMERELLSSQDRCNELTRESNRAQQILRHQAESARSALEMEKQHHNMDVERLEAEIARLKVLVDRSGNADRVQQLENERMAAQLELTDALAQLESRGAQSQEIESAQSEQLKLLNQQLADVQRTKLMLTADNSALSQTLNQARQETENTQRLLAQESNARQALGNELQMLRSKLDVSSRQMEGEKQSVLAQLHQAHKSHEVEMGELNRRLDQARRETCESEMHKGLADERVAELQQRLEDLQRTTSETGDNAMRVRQLMEERDHLQARIDSLESQLKSQRLDRGLHTDRNRDDHLVSQRERERLHDDKAQVNEKLAAANGQLKQLQHELERAREHEQSKDKELATLREQHSVQHSALQSKALEAERLALQLDYEKRDMLKVAAEMERLRSAHLQELSEFKHEATKTTTAAKKAMSEAQEKAKGALKKAQKEHKKAKQVDASLKGLHDENMTLRAQVLEHEMRETRSLKENERTVKDLHRRLELAQGQSHGGVSGHDASSALVNSLQNAFRRENAVLQEIQQMSQGLKF